MNIHHLPRWQRTAAIVPAVLLVSAWGVSLTAGDLARASDPPTAQELPEVPTSALDQPATVQATPGGVDPRAGAEGTLSTLSSAGIPAAALSAYRRAESLLDKADPSCRLDWTLVAAIGRVESDHGRSGSNTLGDDGVSRPGILGVPLTGRGGTAEIRDTDGGKLDDDAVWDRAVGPMQFIPSTWELVAVDADSDDKADPQDVDDAATSAGVYLCAGSDDLSTRPGASAAVKRYNASDSYVSLVLRIAERYAAGEYTATPNGVGPGSTLTSRSQDQTLTAAERREARRAEQGKRPSRSDRGSTPSRSTRPSAPSTSKPGTSPKPGTDSPSRPDSGQREPGPGLTDLVGGVTDPLLGTDPGTTGDGRAPTPGEVVGDVVENTLTWAEAKVKCLAQGLTELDLRALTRCITSLLS